MWIAGVRPSAISVPTCIGVEADAVSPPLVGASSPYRSEDWSGKEEEGERSRDEFHRVSV